MRLEKPALAAATPRPDPEEFMPDEPTFRRLLRRTALTLLFSLLVPIIVLGGMVELLRISAQWVDHTDRVVTEINRVEKLLITMQSNFRGYRLLRDETLLAGYAKAGEELATRLDALQEITGDNPNQIP